jgi:hypothetical protein
MCLIEIGLCPQNYGNRSRLKGGLVRPFHEHKNLHLYNVSDVQMSSRNHEVDGYGHALDFLIILYYLHVAYAKRSGSREKSIHVRPIIYFMMSIIVRLESGQAQYQMLSTSCG